MSYHASTWPLLVPPPPAELLSFLRQFYGLTDLSPNYAVADAFLRAGHMPSEHDMFARVLGIHQARRYEAQTGLPF